MNKVQKFFRDFGLKMAKANGYIPPSPKPLPLRIFIAAANKQHADHWCKISGLNPRDERITYVSDPSILRGIYDDNCLFIWYETWVQHPKSAEIAARINTIFAVTKAISVHTNS